MTIEKFKELSKELELVEEDIRRVESILQNEPFDNISLSYTDNRINYGPALENIVYTYLRSKDYSVSVGRIGKLECDFIVRDNVLSRKKIQQLKKSQLGIQRAVKRLKSSLIPLV